MNLINRVTGVILFLLLACSHVSWGQELVSFPEAEGFGRFSTGARGHENPSVYFVTTLADSGPGSFRDAVSEPGRFVIFKVSGIIRLESNLSIAPYTTLAGHTAPGDGVVIYGQKVSFTGSSNTIARFVRLRLGADTGVGKNTDASGISNGENIMLDHMSFTWGLDEVFSINWDNKGVEPTNISIQNSIIGQGLHRHNHSAGGLIQTSGNISILKSLYASNKTRNPKVKGVNEFVNNVVYNYGNANTTYEHTISADAYILGGESEGESNVTILNNYFMGGPSTPASESTPFSRGNGNFNLYEGGNYFDNNQDGALNGTLIEGNDSWYPGLEPGNFKTAADYSGYPSVSPTMTAEQAYQYLIENVGATRPHRDEVDRFLVSELSSYGTEGFYTYRESDLPLSNGGLGELYPGPVEDDTDGDGIPDSWEDRLDLDKNNPDDALQPSAEGYLNIELYLNQLAEEAEAPVVRPVAQLEATDELFETETPYCHVTLTWENLQENKVVIERSADGETWTELATVGVGVATYDDEQELQPDTDYQYRLKTKTEEGESAYIEVTIRTTAIPTVPDAANEPSPAHEVTGVSLTEGSAVLGWTGSENTVSYEAFFGEDAENLVKVSGEGPLTESSFTVEGLTADKTYFWRVDATNEKGTTTGAVWSFHTEKVYEPQLVGYWKFDETADGDQTVLIDQSDFHTNGVLGQNPEEGAALRTEAGISGGAVDFGSSAGSTYVAYVPHADHLLLSNSSFTMGLWMKADEALKPGSDVSAYIVCKGSIGKNDETGATGNRFNVEVKGDNLRFAIDNDALGKDELTLPSIPYFTGAWTYLTIVRDMENGKLLIYRNGELDGEKTIENAVNGIGETSALVFGNIGELEFLKEGVSPAPYKGQMDEVKLFNYALTPEQITQQYEESLGLLAPHSPTPEDGGLSAKGNQMEVAWQGGGSATGFHIAFGETADELAQVAELPADTRTYLFEGLTPGVTYYWRVDAVDGDETIASEIWSFTTTTAKRELVGYYPFDDAENIGADMSKYANDGVAHDFQGLPFIEGGKYEGAINFAGEANPPTKRLEIPAAAQNLFDNSSFSISLWMKGTANTYTSSDVNSYLFHKGTFSGPGFWYGVQLSHNGNLVFGIDDNKTKTTLDVNIEDANLFNDEWNHIVAVRDVASQSMVVYVNGVRMATKEGVTTEAIGDAEKPLVIGNSTENRSYRDQLDELKLYNYALTDAEVISLFAEAVPTMKAVNIAPANEAVDLNHKETTLSWEGAEESYNVYLGSEPGALELVAEGVEATAYLLSGISGGETYFWRVDAVRDSEVAAGDVWSFTTKDANRQLVGYYHFNNPDNIGEDGSKYGNDGTAIDFPATPYTSEGKKGGAIDFATDETIATKRVEIPSTEQNLFDERSFSISLWLKVANNSYLTREENCYIIHKGTFSGPGYWYGLQVSEGGAVIFGIDDNATKTTIQTDLEAVDLFNGEWNHVTMVRDVDGTSVSLYVNGIQMATKNDVVTTAIGDPEKPLVIGNSTEVRSYRDQLDELKLYNYALSEAEVMNVFEHDAPVFKPANPTPEHQSAGANYPDVALSWEANEDTYQLYLGAEEDQLEFVADLELEEYVWDELEPQTNYYWRVDAFRDGEMATGDVWSFQTASTDREKPIVQDLELQILENVNAGALVGQATAYVIEGGVLENWRIVDFDDPNGNGTAPLRIDPEDGTLYVVDAGDFDYFQQSTFTFDVQVDNGENISDVSTLHIVVQLVNSAPSFTLPESVAVCNGSELQEMTIENVNPGRESDQQVALALSTTQAFLFDSLGMERISDSEYRLVYRFIDDVQGLVTLSLTATDNGGTENGGMNSYSADLVFDVNSLPEITISTNGSAQALEGKQATLSLDQTLPANYNYQWFKNNELIGEQSYAVVLAEPGVTYQVTVTSPLGCSVSATTELMVIGVNEDIDIEIGNIITPNFDGFNDEWLIKNLGLFNENEVIVYNNAGKVVFQERNYRNNWNATGLATGTYFYRVVVDGVKHTGTLNIIN